MTTADAPTYIVSRNADQPHKKHETASFSCPCGTKHTHGLPSKVGVPEHRVAHCADGDLHPNSYFLVWDGSGAKKRNTHAR